YPTTREGLENFLGGVRAERPGLLVAAGRLADDVAVARALRRRRIVVPTALVAAGVRAFGEALGAAADGFVGPSQWEPTAPLAPVAGARGKGARALAAARGGVAWSRHASPQVRQSPDLPSNCARSAPAATSLRVQPVRCDLDLDLYVRSLDTHGVGRDPARG